MKDSDHNNNPEVIRIAGVPEYFNEPWKIGIEENLYRLKKALVR